MILQRINKIKFKGLKDILMMGIVEMKQNHRIEMGDGRIQIFFLEMTLVKTVVSNIFRKYFL